MKSHNIKRIKTFFLLIVSSKIYIHKLYYQIELIIMK